MLRCLTWGSRQDKDCSLACCCSLAKSCPILQPHGLQHPRLPCPSPSPGAFSNSCPLSHSCRPAILSSVVPFSYLQSFPALGSFLMSQLFTAGGQNNRASASVIPVNIQCWFPLGLTGLISLLKKRPSRIFSCTTVWSCFLFIQYYYATHKGLL